MTATKACWRHARGTSRTRVKCRRPKAANDRRRAKRVLKATPAAPLPALAPDGAGSGGALEGTEPRDEPDAEAT